MNGDIHQAIAADESSQARPGPDEAAYWLAFARVPHIGPARIERLLQRFGTLERAWSAPTDTLRAVLDARPLQELLESRSKNDPVMELAVLRARGIAVTYPGSSGYPALLAEISGRPSVLYVRGTLSDADGESIGVVGTRRATPYGRQVAADVSSHLARSGVTVISGLARGIDAVAHHTALEAGGRTIAVLGSGVDVIYPSEHRRLAERIMENGAIVSEQPPGAKPDAQNFPARNRIISGMSRGVVIVEAPLRSGAMITATFAADQGRDVFVVPGSVHSASSEGCNQLLRDGARIVRGGEDLLDDLGLSQPRAVTMSVSQLMLDPDQTAILTVIGPEPRHIDEIAESVGQTTSSVAAHLMALELQGLVRNHGAQFYVRR